jgi:RNA polymerase sigma-32 factor
MTPLHNSLVEMTTPKKKEKKEKSGTAKLMRKGSRSANLPVKSEYPMLPTSDAALHYYIKKINEYPILTEDEEKKLVKAYTQHKDIEAVKQLVQSNLRLVVRIAMEYSNAYQNLMDLIQEGSVGLMKAVKMYDPKKGSRLSYYATWWIRSYILKYIMDNFRLVKVGTTQSQKKLFFNLMREKQKMEAMGFEPQEARKLLATQFEVPEKKIDEMSGRLQRSEKSLDAPMGAKGSDTDDLYLIDMIEEKSPSALEKLLTKERRERLIGRLQKFSKTLNKKEQLILKKRLLSEVPKTLQDLGNDFGVTKERVRQLEERLKKRLKDVLEGLEDPT